MSRTPAPRRLAQATLLCTALVLGGCATTAPVVYPKASVRADADTRARADIQHCTEVAERAVGRNGLNPSTAARQAGSTAGIGFAAAAVGGLVSKTRGVWERARGAAAGGAAGMLTKLMFDWNEGDEVFQGYVERCLHARGHDVLGWR